MGMLVEMHLQRLRELLLQVLCRHELACQRLDTALCELAGSRPECVGVLVQD